MLPSSPPPSSIPSQPSSPSSRRKSKSSKHDEDEDEDDPGMIEESEELQKEIHANLTHAYIGTIKLYASDIETDWQVDDIKAHPNRMVDQDGVDQLLKEFEAGNCRRLHEDNHMRATTTKANAIAIFEALGTAGILSIPSSSRKLDDLLDHYKKQIFGLNQTAEFPLLSPASKESFEMSKPEGILERVLLQAGQHRLKALETWQADDPDEQWWPVKLYLAEHLSLASIETLRLNKTTVVFDLSDGERACQIWDYKQDVKRLTDERRVQSPRHQSISDCENARGRADADRLTTIDREIAQIEGAIEVKMSEFKPGSKAKANGLLRPKDFKSNLHFVQSIVHACRLSGLARDFSFAALGEIQGLRITDVFPSISKNSKVYVRILWSFANLSVLCLF